MVESFIHCLSTTTTSSFIFWRASVVGKGQLLVMLKLFVKQARGTLRARPTVTNHENSV
jgi:hypothetical protein